MAEFCKECFYSKLADYSDVITKMSNSPELCEGCGKIKPVVVSVKEIDISQPFACLVKQGKCVLDDINDYIEFWHCNYFGNKTLREFLGLTEQQFEILGKLPIEVLNNLI